MASEPPFETELKAPAIAAARAPEANFKKEAPLVPALGDAPKTDEAKNKLQNKTAEDRLYEIFIIKKLRFNFKNIFFYRRQTAKLRMSGLEDLPNFFYKKVNF
jgi:hypothetical protein